MVRTSFSLDGESLVTSAAVKNELSNNVRVQEADGLPEAQAQMMLLLEVVARRLTADAHPGEAIDYLCRQLHRMRQELPGPLWHDIVPLAQHHPVAALIHQDPFTGWSFEKPRGYSGDAQLLDHIYRHPSVAQRIADASPLGRGIYDYTSEAPASAAVRDRRDILARLVDRTAFARTEPIEILTVASGNLREAELTRALGEGRIARWVALDQDPLSVGTIARDFAGTPVEAFDGSVRGLLTRAYDLGAFDLVYAAGLYDYLPLGAAVRLTKTALSMLKPGGTFLFANFSDEIADDGYMETFMDWSLILRSESEVMEIVNGAVDRNQVEMDLFYNDNRNIIYVTLTKT